MVAYSPLARSSATVPEGREAAGGFRALDAFLRAERSTGARPVVVGDPASVDAVVAHIVRRTRSRGRFIAAPRVGAGGNFWREVGRLVGMTTVPTDIVAAADGLAAGLQKRSAVVVVTSAQSAWSQAVSREVERHLRAEGGTALMLRVMSGPVSRRPAADSSGFVVDECLEAADLSVWWEATLASGPLATARPALARLETWWSSSLRSFAQADVAEVVLAASATDDDRTLLARLCLAACSWPLADLARLSPGRWSVLVESGVAVVDSGGVTAAVRGHAAMEATESDLRASAEALVDVFPHDAWAQGRAAVLFAQGGDFAKAEQTHRRSLGLADDAIARGDLWVGWSHAVASAGEGVRVGLLTRGADLALHSGDVDAALEFAEAATRLAVDDSATLLLLGRALLARGDVVAARVSLERAAALTSDSGLRAAVTVELAEGSYLQGKFEDAEKLARDAERFAAREPTRLHASNTLGKLLLARGAWQAAEAHFAADDAAAGRCGDESARLRARVNRAIAVLSDGRSDEAKPMLEAVLAEGEARDDQRAVAFALSNLTVLAITRHDFSEAVELSERAISLWRRLGERINLARKIVNVAELRLRLGLFEQAEQAIAFGRSAAPLPHSAELSCVAAEIALLRGNTRAAAHELALATAGAVGASDGDIASQCHRLATRIALENGDLDGADAALAKALACPVTPASEAEIALLRALIMRARGVPATLAASAAVERARVAEDDEFLIQSLTLAGEVALAEGQTRTALRYVGDAAGFRDRIANTLSASLRASFLARPDLVALVALERQLASVDEAVPSTARPSVTAPLGAPSAARPFVGVDPAVLALLNAVRKVASTDSTVLVLGESGTGKELVAEALHEASARRSAPLVKVNCAALVESLLLSELFGHERGAFTGAATRKRGRFELAEGGTLFLDEIGDISPATQVALLRVLQERTFERVGGTTPLRANVRVVCATHRDLRGMVERGEFRQDLYFRLSGFVLEVPALRARLGDLPLLSRTLLERIAAERDEQVKTLASDALALLHRHRWPGNIRELENALRAASLFADGPSVTAHDFLYYVEGLRSASFKPAPDIELPGAPPAPPSSTPSADAAEGSQERLPTLTPPTDAVTEIDATDLVYARLRKGETGLFDVKRQIERDCIGRALAETSGNITRAATLLGMKRPRLSQLVKQYGFADLSAEDS